ncbi:hypothetical protein ACTXT7_008458 [Hymenolepis weldensis]
MFNKNQASNPQSISTQNELSEAQITSAFSMCMRTNSVTLQAPWLKSSTGLNNMSSNQTQSTEILSSSSFQDRLQISIPNENTNANHVSSDSGLDVSWMAPNSVNASGNPIQVSTGYCTNEAAQPSSGPISKAPYRCRYCQKPYARRSSCRYVLASSNEIHTSSSFNGM